jgi:peptidoglycan hydrolase-like protein with peptidoglycan-binding domain
VAYIDPQDYTDTSATDTATVTVASSGGGGGGSSGSSSSGGGVVLFAPYNPGATVGSQTQTPPAVEPPPPAQNTNTSSSGGISSALRAEITPVIAILLTGPIYTNKTDTQNRILQFLLAGDPTIYPEGQITGYYGPLTKKAVQRFQTKFGITTASDPYYGYAGPATRAKIREALGR